MTVRRLATAVVVHHPAGSVLLPAGCAPAPEHAALVTNPACWDDDGDPPEDPAPDRSWTVDALRTWAHDHGIDLGAARTKADVLMVITDQTTGDPDAALGDT